MVDVLPGLESIENIHPLFVHFPVALILVSLLFEGLWWLTRKDQFRALATYLLYLSAISAVAAVITGYIASDSLGHDAPGHDFVHEHRDVMIWMSGLLLATTLLVLFIRSLREGKARRLVIVPLFITSVLLIYGADRGGRLVFEYGTGVRATVDQGVQDSESDVPDNQPSTRDSISTSEKATDEHGHVH